MAKDTKSYRYIWDLLYKILGTNWHRYRIFPTWVGAGVTGHQSRIKFEIYSHTDLYKIRSLLYKSLHNSVNIWHRYRILSEYRWAGVTHHQHLIIFKIPVCTDLYSMYGLVVQICTKFNELIALDIEPYRHMGEAGVKYHQHRIIFEILVCREMYKIRGLWY